MMRTLENSDATESRFSAAASATCSLASTGSAPCLGDAYTDHIQIPNCPFLRLVTFVRLQPAMLRIAPRTRIWFVSGPIFGITLSG